LERLHAKYFGIITAFIEEKRESIKMIINALKDRFVCLKMDTATRFNHGVNAQFIEDEKFFINTLVLIEL